MYQSNNYIQGYNMDICNKQKLIDAINESPCKATLFKQIGLYSKCLRFKTYSSADALFRDFENECMVEHYNIPKLQDAASAIDKICGWNTTISNAFWQYTSEVIWLRQGCP